MIYFSIFATIAMLIFHRYLTVGMEQKDKSILFANCANVYVISARHELDDTVEATAEALRAKLAECGNQNDCKVISIPFNGYSDGRSTLNMNFAEYRRFVREIEDREWAKYHTHMAKMHPSYASEKFSGQSKGGVSI